MSDTSFWHPFANMASVSSNRLTITRSSGNYVFDSNDNGYLDATASLWYANVGHGRQEIVTAIAQQAEKLACYSTFGDITNEPAEELAHEIAEISPITGSKIFFGSGGGDAIETAAKLSRRYFFEIGQSERTIIVSRDGSYHGTHGFGTSMAGILPNRVGYGTLINDIAIIDRDDPRALSELALRVGSDKIAAVFVEPVVGAGGVHLPTEGYLTSIAAICMEIGALLVVDSVICGFGRLGYWFGPERFGVVPDMITFAKGITSGYIPLGGVVISPKISDPFFNDSGATFRHGPTYAGHPIACAAGIANLKILKSENLIPNGELLETDLSMALMASSDSPIVTEVRSGLGLLGAIEISSDFQSRFPSALGEIQGAMRRRGVLVRPLVTSIAVSPPLTITKSEIELIGNTFIEALKEVVSAPR
ncbi:MULTISPECIES: aminotransferase class III-fold pyridoxal phosphate-dependent enzyme [Acidithrix]|uniref:L-lysine--8-amino-7-oxononanoate transaminase n=1 Tax=Acidithrix ferrooxidans TaxID=1280514 RepID=A0A0D8HDU7_9ACTN|nr:MULTISPECIES: aminotransferase class III-fold pyridoxal phosphate-dependent enzyme [Acidithrix]KJF16135.1 L-lysine--8-amino-7-oxononanoate transaminase [Acidithrix ferrooxidans]CAG4903318.1 unnamed protein product [Acidithrix sp. C25]